MLFKQPREDVSGTDRDDLLLSLDEAAVTHRSIIAAQAYQLYRAVMIGNPPSNVQRLYERIREPKIGDLVLVIDSLMRRSDPDGQTKGLGILLEDRTEYIHTDAEWAREIADYDDGDGDIHRPTDRFWYVQYGSAAIDVCRWTDCNPITVLTDPFEVSKMFGRRDGNGVTLTRDDVLGSLADSGFELKLPRS